MSTRADLRAEARQLADQDDSTFPTDAQYNIALNRGGTKVFLDLLAAGWPCNFSTTTISANGSTLTYAFGGSDLVVGVVLVYTDIGGMRLELKRVNSGDVARLRSQQAVGQFSEYYEVRHDVSAGPVVELLPRVAGTYYVDYIPGFSGFANDSSVWRGPYGSDELVALYAARFGARKEGRVDDAAVLLQDYGTALKDLQRTAGWLDLRNAPRIRESVQHPGLRNPFDYPAVGPNSLDF